MNIRLKMLFEFKNTLMETLKQHWSEQTRREIESRIKDIDEDIDRISNMRLVA